MDGEWLLYTRKSVGIAGISRQRTSTIDHLARRGGTVAGGDEYSDTDRTAYRNIRDDIDAPMPPRPGFDGLLAELARRPGIGIAAWHPDRLGRDPEATEILIRACRRGGHLISTTRGGDYDLATANGRKHLRDDINAAAHEVDHAIERMTEAKSEAAGEGRFLGGGRPFGWQLADGLLTLDPAEAPLIEQGCADVLAGVPLAEIARRWSAAGSKGSRGGRWDGVTVRLALMRARNAGLMEHRGAVTGPAQWPAIVKEDTWRSVRSVLSDPSRRSGPGAVRRHLLSGIALCHGCGNPVTAGQGTGGTRYLCARSARQMPRRPGVTHVSRESEAVDAYIRALAIKRLRQPDAAGLLRADTSAARSVLIQREAELRADYDGLHPMWRAKVLTDLEFARDRAEITADLEAVRAKRAGLDEADLLAPMLADPEGEWERRGVHERQAVVSALMMITLLPARYAGVRRPAGWRPGDRWFDAGLIDVRWARRLPSDG